MKIEIFYVKNGEKIEVKYTNGEPVFECDLLKIENEKDIFAASLYRDRFMLVNISTGEKIGFDEVTNLENIGSIYKTYIPIAYKKEIATEVGTKEQRDFIKKIIEKVEKSKFYYENFIKKG